MKQSEISAAFVVFATHPSWPSVTDADLKAWLDDTTAEKRVVDMFIDDIEFPEVVLLGKSSGGRNPTREA